METKANYVLIGGATVIGFALLMIFAMWLANASFRGTFAEYDVIFEDPVRGLAEGGEVRFNGIKVGEVKNLRIDPENTTRVIARIQVSSDVPLRVDSEARLEPIGLTGVTLIQLSAGTPGRPALRSGGFGARPRLHGRGSQIDVLVERSEDIALRASEAMAAVRDLLTDENIQQVTEIIHNLNSVSRQLSDEQSVIHSSAEAARSLTLASRSIQALADEMKVDLAEAHNDFHSAADVATGQTLPEITRAAEEIRRAASDIQRVAQTIDQNPSVLAPRAPRPTVELQP